MKTLRYLPIICTISLNAFALSNSIPTTGVTELDDLRVRYEGVESRIEADAQVSRTMALSEYGESLTGILSTLKQQGNLDSYLLVEKEMSRFAKEAKVPKQRGKPEWALVDEAIATYAGALDNATNVQHDQTKNLHKAYIRHLKALIKRLMLDDRIEDAKVVRDEIERAETERADYTSTVAKEQNVTTELHTAISVFPAENAVRTNVGKLKEGERIANNRSYTFSSVPTAVRGLNFLRMECKKNGDYTFEVKTQRQMFVLVLPKWSDTEILAKSGWVDTGVTLVTSQRERVSIYGRNLKPGTYHINSGRVYPYMLATRAAIAVVGGDASADAVPAVPKRNEPVRKPDRSAAEAVKKEQEQKKERKAAEAFVASIYDKYKGANGKYVDMEKVLISPETYKNEVLWSSVYIAPASENVIAYQTRTMAEYYNFMSMPPALGGKVMRVFATRMELGASKIKYFCTGELEGGIRTFGWVLLDVQ